MSCINTINRTVQNVWPVIMFTIFTNIIHNDIFYEAWTDQLDQKLKKRRYISTSCLYKQIFDCLK